MRQDRAYPCRHIWFLLVLLAILAAVVTAGLACGSAAFSLRQLAGGFLRKPGYETEAIILHALRLPRVAAGILAGVGLSVAGVLLQAMTNNALASPNIIGVNAGAGFCVILCLCFFPTAFAALPLAAFVGAFATTLFIVTVAGRARAPADHAAARGHRLQCAAQCRNFVFVAAVPRRAALLQSFFGGRLFRRGAGGTGRAGGVDRGLSARPLWPQPARPTCCAWGTAWRHRWASG